MTKTIKDYLSDRHNDTTRIFNPSVYAENYAVLANAGYAHEAVSTLLRQETMYIYNKLEKSTNPKERKALKEDLNDILTKIENFGEDVWRTIKKLLKRLIIWLEETIVYLFDKTNSAKKISVALSVSLKKLSGFASNNPTKPFTEGQLGLPTELHDNIIVDWFDLEKMFKLKFIDEGAKDWVSSYVPKDKGTGEPNFKNLQGITREDHRKVNGPNNTYYSDMSDFENKSVSDMLKTIEKDFQHNQAIALRKTAIFWKTKTQSKQHKIREIKKDYKHVAKIAKAVEYAYRSGGYKHNSLDTPEMQYISSNINGVTNSGFSKSGDLSAAEFSTNPTEYFLWDGVMFETISAILDKNIRHKKMIVPALIVKKKLHRERYADTLAEIHSVGYALLYYLNDSIATYTLMRDMYFEYKKHANELLNVKTEITDSYKPELNSAIQTIIGRSTQAAHKILNNSKIVMVSYTKMGAYAHTAINKIVNILQETSRYENDDYDL